MKTVIQTLLFVGAAWFIYRYFFPHSTSQNNTTDSPINIGQVGGTTKSFEMPKV